ncbi:F221B-like protein [Mya arenaria]|uniref:F221B-like protein n=1 Tax=Mya arenaria TaxID=6604 RepID=A0ABY7E1J1_MYAAR|nr:F221B-like protein [Mya arenaria]
MSKRQPPSKSAASNKAGGTGGVAGKSVVPRGGRAVVPRNMPAPIPMTKKDGMLVPEGYTMRKIEPAKNYDVESFARAMNPDFAPRLKKLFDQETEAAAYTLAGDCQSSNTTVSGLMTCPSASVAISWENMHSTQGFAWVPSRAEDVGEFWLQRRRDFDPSTWRAKCRCKHTHEEHEAAGSRRCKKNCGCGHFNSNFLCAACDKHWEDHETFFETEDDRVVKGLPVGEMYLPFAEMPHLRNIALTGDEDDDSRYLALVQGEGSIPRRKQIEAGNHQPFPQQGASKSGFKPVYD